MRSKILYINILFVSKYFLKVTFYIFFFICSFLYVHFLVNEHNFSLKSMLKLPTAIFFISYIYLNLYE